MTLSHLSLSLHSQLLTEIVTFREPTSTSYTNRLVSPPIHRVSWEGRKSRLRRRSRSRFVLEIKSFSKLPTPFLSTRCVAHRMNWLRSSTWMITLWRHYKSWHETSSTLALKVLSCILLSFINPDGPTANLVFGPKNSSLPSSRISNLNERKSLNRTIFAFWPSSSGFWNSSLLLGRRSWLISKVRTPPSIALRYRSCSCEALI